MSDVTITYLAHRMAIYAQHVFFYFMRHSKSQHCTLRGPVLHIRQATTCCPLRAVDQSHALWLLLEHSTFCLSLRGCFSFGYRSAFNSSMGKQEHNRNFVQLVLSQFTSVVWAKANQVHGNNRLYLKHTSLPEYMHIAGKYASMYNMGVYTVCMCICVYVCTYVSMYVCVHLCIYVHVHVWQVGILYLHIQHMSILNIRMYPTHIRYTCTTRCLTYQCTLKDLSRWWHHRLL